MRNAGENGEDGEGDDVDNRCCAHECLSVLSIQRLVGQPLAGVMHKVNDPANDSDQSKGNKACLLYTSDAADE